MPALVSALAPQLLSQYQCPGGSTLRMAQQLHEATATPHDHQLFRALPLTDDPAPQAPVPHWPSNLYLSPQVPQYAISSTALYKAPDTQENDRHLGDLAFGEEH